MIRLQSSFSAAILGAAFLVNASDINCNIECISNNYDISHAADAILKRRRKEKAEKESHLDNEPDKICHLDIKTDDTIKKLTNGICFSTGNYNYS